MHNLDRTQAETYGETYEYGPAEFGYETSPEYTGEYASEYTGEYPGEYGEYGEMTGEYAGEYAGEYPGEYGEYGEMTGEYAGEYPGEYGEYTGELESESPMNEALEMELASELLEVSNEEELDRFLGKVFGSIGRIVKLPVVRQLGGMLKSVAKKALPIVGGALGSMVAPGIGTAIGSQLGSLASRLFEVQLEGLSAEDQEFEVARRFVRLAASSAQRAAMAPPNVPPRIVAQRAFNAAARRYAPGMVNAFGPRAERRRRVYPRRAPAPSAVPGAAAVPWIVPPFAPAYVPGVPVAPGPVPGAAAAPRAVPPSAPAYAPGVPVAPAYAPGVTRRRWPRSGRWFRRGRNVVLVGYYG